MLSVETMSPTDKRELVQRIVASKQFFRSERLSSFLSHICELEIEGRLSELNEKEIGRTVFNLPGNYDPSIDGIVRSHASRLRRKLELYYLREGSGESIRLAIPRGRYQPQFEWIQSQPAGSEAAAFDETSLAEGIDHEPPTASDETPHAGKSQQPTRQHLQSVSLAIAVIFVVAVGGMFYHSIGRLFFARNEAGSIWSEIFTRQRPTILVPGDSGVVMWQESMQQNLSLSDYISSTSPWKSNKVTAGQEHLPNALLRRRYTSIVDLDIVQKLSRLAYANQVDPVLRYARDVRPNDLKDSNVILIGSSETNPWTQMFQSEMNFVLHKDQKQMIYTIENRRPSTGEPSGWSSDSLVDLHTVFCKVSYLANPNGDGNVLLLEGTSMAGTECAWEFVSGKESLRRFLAQIHWSEPHPPHFEILLKTNNLAGESSASNIVAWRIDH